MMRTVVKYVKKYDAELIKFLLRNADEEYRSLGRQFFSSPKNFLLVAFAGESPCGFLYGYFLDPLNAQKPIVFLYSIDVFKEYRRKGIGTLLMEKLVNRCRKNRCGRIFVFTNTSNKAAMKFYSAMGGVRQNRDDAMFLFQLSNGMPQRKPAIDNTQSIQKRNG